MLATYDNITNMHIPGAIPVRTYLYKYVLFRENLQSNETLDLCRRGTIPRFLSVLIEGKLNTDDYRNQHTPQTDHFESLLNFRIDLWRSKRSKIIITIEGIRLFDNFLYDDFHDYLLSRILLARAEGDKEKEVIEQVMHDLDIVDDISFDALKKSSYRLRNLRKIPHFRDHKCLLA